MTHFNHLYYYDTQDKQKKTHENKKKWKKEEEGFNSKGFNKYFAQLNPLNQS